MTGDVQMGVPFSGELLAPGMVVAVHTHCERVTSRCHTTTQMGTLECERVEVEHRCLERSNDPPPGLPLTVLAVMYPFVVVQDDDGAGGIVDVRDTSFVLVPRRYRAAVAAASRRQVDQPAPERESHTGGPDSRAAVMTEMCNLLLDRLVAARTPQLSPRKKRRR